MNCSNGSNRDVALPMKNPVAVLHTSKNFLFETARTDPHGAIPVLAGEVGLNKKQTLTPTEVATAGHDEAYVEFENRHIGNS